MQRADTQSSLGKGSELAMIGKGPRRTSTWKSQAASAHSRTLESQRAEEVPEPKEIHNVRTYLIAITVCMGAVAYGYDTGFFGGTLALPSFVREFGNTSQTKANLVSLFQGGSFFGAGLQLPFTERFGRKWSIIFANVMFIASAFAQTFAGGSVSIFMFGRFLGGFAVGFLSLVVPVYLSEFAPASIRGRLVGMFDIGIQVGTLGGFWINYGIQGNLPSNRFQWQLPVFLQLVPATLLMIGIPFCPETPRWLILKGRDEEALKNLTFLRHLGADHEYIQYEFRSTKQQVEEELLIRGNQSLFQLVKGVVVLAPHRNRVLLGMALIFFKTFSGVQAVNYYSPIIFEQLGFVGTQNSLFATGIYGTCKFVFTLIFGLWMVDRVGRRLPLIVGSIVLSLCLIFIGGYLTGEGPKADGEPRNAGDYVSITAIFLYASVYCLGWNSVPLTLISEIFTARFRTVSMSMVLMWQWLCTFAIVQIMPHALENITTRTYFIFGCIFIFGAPFCYVFVPETKGLSLENMDKLFGGGRTDVEKALEEGEKEKPTVEHVEHGGTKAGPPLAPIHE